MYLLVSPSLIAKFVPFFPLISYIKERPHKFFMLDLCFYVLQLNFNGGFVFLAVDRDDEIVVSKKENSRNTFSQHETTARSIKKNQYSTEKRESKQKKKNLIFVCVCDIESWLENCAKINRGIWNPQLVSATQTFHQVTQTTTFKASSRTTRSKALCRTQRCST